MQTRFDRTITVNLTYSELLTIEIAMTDGIDEQRRRGHVAMANDTRRVKKIIFGLIENEIRKDEENGVIEVD
jgi:hypothetical protein